MLFASTLKRIQESEWGILMQILNNTKGTWHYNKGQKSKSSGEKEASVNGLKKSEVIADIFNNRDLEEQEKRPLRISLSYTSKALLSDLRKNIKSLLSQDKQLAKAIDNLDLPGNDHIDLSQNPDLALRKMNAYVMWLEVHENNEEPLPENDLFSEVHNCGKDEVIKDLFQNVSQKHVAINQERQKYAPNYYYTAFPEAYSFN